MSNDTKTLSVIDVAGLAIEETKQALSCPGAQTKAIMALPSFDFNVPCGCYDNVLLPIPTAISRALSKKILGGGIKAAQLVAKYFPTAGKQAIINQVSRTLTNNSRKISNFNLSISEYIKKRAGFIESFNYSSGELRLRHEVFRRAEDKYRTSSQKLENAIKIHNDYMAELRARFAPGWPKPGQVPVGFGIGEETGKDFVSKYPPPNWVGDVASWKKEAKAILRRLYGYDDDINLARLEVEDALSDVNLAELNNLLAEKEMSELSKTIEKYNKKIKSIQEDIKPLQEKNSELQIDLNRANSGEDVSSLARDLSDKYGLEQIFTGILVIVVESLGYFGVVDKHLCEGALDTGTSEIRGAQLDELTCKCTVCPEGMVLCDAETWWTQVKGSLAQLPLERVGDEQNYCLNPCSCGKTYFQKFWNGGLWSDWVVFMGNKPCYCGCEDRYKNPADPEPVPYELKHCYKTECGQSTSSIGKFCATKYPPDDEFGNMHRMYPDWRSKYFWSPNKEYCRWVETPCDDVIFGGVQYSGVFVAGRAGECRYDVTCYDCSECPQGKTLSLKKSEADGKSCFDLNLKASCDDCPCEDITFGGEAVSGQRASGECKYEVTCYECSECPEGRILSLKKSEAEGKNCTDLDLKISCNDCPCQDITFGGKAVSGQRVSGECKYEVTCYECSKCPEATTLTLGKEDLDGKSCPDLSSFMATFKSSCSDEDCPCEDITFEGVSVSGQRVSGECQYQVSCYGCEDCQNIKTITVTAAQADGKGCSDLTDASTGERMVKECSYENCCGPVTFGGKQYDGSFVDGVCKYTVECYECRDGECFMVDADLTKQQILAKPNCSDWPSSTNKRYNSCDDVSRDLSNDCCGSVVFGSSEYQGSIVDGLCKYDVTCYECQGDNCTGVSATLTKQQIREKPNCSDWSTPTKNRYNSCNGINCCNGITCNEDFETCVNGECCPTERACPDICCPEGQECVNGQCCPSAQTCGNQCCNEDFETCVNGECCPAERACGNTCCPDGQECINGQCCPNGRVCNGGCCPDGETCCGNTCCPDTVKGEKFICNGNECVTESYFCQGTDIWTT